MGYEIQITRKETWFDEGPDILLDEWLSVVRADPEMRNDGYAEATVGEGSVLRVEDPSMSVWIAYSKHAQDGNMAWLWHSNGNVMAKNPDEEMLKKMHRIATLLSAKTQGDEGVNGFQKARNFGFCTRFSIWHETHRVRLPAPF